MVGMKFQFSTSTLLLATAFVAITIGGIGTVHKLFDSPFTSSITGSAAAAGAPLWLPVVFGAYAFARNRLDVKCVIAFAVTEALAVIWFAWMFG